ncbi:MAG: hypothetical protein O2955_09985 [Planctomycetota bacterium]|nr:hypothetical protein [Planctomycetota bacterium]MDA1212840.1 hypothetical protein [Planctomycetota bacterium]
MADIDEAISQLDRFDITHENLRVIGEATFDVEIGIGCESHCYAFVIVDPLRIQYYEIFSIGPRIEELIAELEIPKSPRLWPVSKSENVVVWPKQLEGRPFLKLVRISRGSRLWHRVLDFIFPLFEYELTDEIEAYVKEVYKK